MLTAKLKPKHREFPYTHPALSAIHSFPDYQHSAPGGTCVATDESTLTHYYPSKSVVYVKVHSWWCMLCGFGQMFINVYIYIFCISIQIYHVWYYTEYNTLL